MKRFSGRVVGSIAEVEAAAWDACLPDEAESHAYYRACDEAAAASGIGVRGAAAMVTDGGAVVAVTPIFRLDYRLDTPLQGRPRRISEAIFRHCPGLVTLKVLCIGSPYAERCHVGYAPDLDIAARLEVMRVMLAALERQAEAEGAHLVAFKDLAPAEDALLAPLLGEAGFARLGSLPVATLDLPYAGDADYLASLSAATRKDIRRKLAKASSVRIEYRSDISGLEAVIEELYESTRCESKLDYGDLEVLPPSYFSTVSKALGCRAVFALYWVGDELAAFNLLLVESDRVIDKFLGMRYPLAREHNLYAVSWMANVRFCLERGIRQLQTGQTAYSSKLRFGSRLLPSTIRFRHRSRTVQWLLGRVSSKLSLAHFDPDLAAGMAGQQKPLNGGRAADADVLQEATAPPPEARRFLPRFLFDRRFSPTTMQGSSNARRPSRQLEGQRIAISDEGQKISQRRIRVVLAPVPRISDQAEAVSITHLAESHVRVLGPCPRLTSDGHPQAATEHAYDRFAADCMRLDLRADSKAR